MTKTDVTGNAKCPLIGNYFCPSTWVLGMLLCDQARGATEVLKKRDFMMIQDLIQQGVSQKDVAERLGVHPKTVRRALRRGSAPKGPWPRRGAALDPFKPQIDALLAEGVWNAAPPEDVHPYI
ncbi:MAG: helix-turn-helix domain-containing protein [Acidiferrobacteraceae bacterium]